MQRSLPNEPRKVVPRWRELSRTPGPELLTSKPRRVLPLGTAVPSSTELESSQSFETWKALELVSGALVTGRTDATDEAVKSLAGIDLAPGGQHLLKLYNRDVSAITVASQEESAVDERAVAVARVRELKALVIDFPRNALFHVELARAYASLGENDRASHYLHVALALAPENRYVIRSATRFFVHARRPEEIWKWLKPFGSGDPWIAASRISIADLLQKAQGGIKQARETVDRGDPSQVTELAAALGTLELGSGAIKKAKPYFAKSARKPNDNAVAQLRWAHEVAGFRFDPQLLKVELSYEARTAQAVEEQRWSDGVKNARLWLGDEPFSIRAALTGIFICAEYTLDFEQALQFCNLALIANPHSPTLLNNKAFVLANLGITEEAEANLKAARSRAFARDSEVFLKATEGCIAYRRRDILGGALLYDEAVRLAEEIGDRVLALRGRMHWLHEELRRGERLPLEMSEKLDAYFVSQDTEIKSAYDCLIRPYLNVSAIQSEGRYAESIAQQMLQ